MKTRKIVCSVLIITLIICCVPFAANAGNDLYVSEYHDLYLSGLTVYDNIYLTPQSTLYVYGPGTLVVNGGIYHDGDGGSNNGGQLIITGGTVLIHEDIVAGIVGTIYIGGDADVTVNNIFWMYGSCTIDAGAKVFATGSIYPQVSTGFNHLRGDGATIVALGDLDATASLGCQMYNVEITNPQDYNMPVMVLNDGVVVQRVVLPAGQSSFWVATDANVEPQLIFDTANGYKVLNLWYDSSITL